MKALRVTYTLPDPSFLPTDIAGLNLWLDASQGVYKDAAMTLPCSDGDSVYTFKDMSSSGNNAIQGLGANQPKKYDNILNGKSVIRFNGSEFLAKSLWDYGENSSLFVVYKVNGTFCGVIGSSYIWYGSGIQYYQPNGIYCMNAGATGSVFYPKPTFPNYIINSMISNTSVHKLYENGTYKIQIGYNGHGVGTLYLGDRGDMYPGILLQGDIAEILIYNSELSDTDRLLVETYLNSKYIIY